MLATGNDLPAILRFFRSIPILTAQIGEINLFVDAELAKRFSLWRHARELNITHYLNLIDNLEGNRQPLLESTVLIQPEAIGFHHSFTLDAMMHSMLVVAAADPNVEYLIDKTTSILLEDTSPAHWAKVVATLLSSPDQATTLRTTAHEYVTQNRSLAHYIDRIMTNYTSAAHLETPSTPPTAAS